MTVLYTYFVTSKVYIQFGIQKKRTRFFRYRQGMAHLPIEKTTQLNL